jgi:predicted house-cleaning noncanonical NTP pyrophosphatase (MazG superfamily)
MTLRRFKFDKLIRDKAPDIMRNLGIIVHDRIMDNQEKIVRLKEKLIEEANEVMSEANTLEELCEEIADVLEVISALSNAIGITQEQINKTRQKKYSIKGGFEKGIYCSTIEASSDNPDLAEYIMYYQTHPRYPEIK